MPAHTPVPTRAITHLARAFVALLAAVAVLLPTVEPAHAADKQSRWIAAATVTAGKGQQAPITARLVGPGGGSLSNQPVTFWRYRDGAWRKVDTLRTNLAGRVTKRVTVNGTQTYQFRYAGNGTFAGSRSVVIRTKVAFGARVIAKARTHYGKPYKWGATGPSRFDCSGFTGYVFRQVGKNLPRTSRQQYAASRKVAPSAKRVGDLIFKYDGSGRIYHVGIYAGNGRMWAATSSGDIVRMQAVSGRYKVGRF